MSKTLSMFWGTDDGSEDLKRAQECDALDATAISYYSGLSEEEVQEQSTWGRFSLGNFWLKSRGDRPGLLRALRDKAGLNLAPRRGPFQLLVIGRAEHPPGN